ncbi:MAG: hypothetical protein M1816_007706 [Peltula sp. TS41687]|nr:MAG: hypothetical protein M1816_007706 [Peltula sp. TS41687]
MRPLWFLLFAMDFSITAALPITTPSSGSILRSTSEDTNPPVVPGTNGTHQQPSRYLGRAAKLGAAFIGGFIAFKTAPQRFRDALGNMFGSPRKDSNGKESNNSGESSGESDKSKDELLAKIEREKERTAPGRDPTNNPSDHLTQAQRDVRDECLDIKWVTLSAPQRYAYRKYGPEEYLKEWDETCGDPERARAFVETYHRQRDEQKNTGQTPGVNAFESVRLPQANSNVLLTKLGAIVRAGQKKAEGQNPFVNLPGGSAASFQYHPIP